MSNPGGKGPLERPKQEADGMGMPRKQEANRGHILYYDVFSSAVMMRLIVA
jgi:hypothetical protein